MHNTFVRRHALAEIAGRVCADGASRSRDSSRQPTGYLVARKRPGALERGMAPRPGSRPPSCSPASAKSSTALSVADQRTGRACTGRLVERVLVGHQPVLNDDQAAAVRAITSSGRGVDAVAALAGTGKTTMIAALAACYQQAGWRVIGAAPTGRAARQLRDAAGIPAGTMHALAGELRRARRFPATHGAGARRGRDGTHPPHREASRSRRARPRQSDRCRRPRPARLGRGRRLARRAHSRPAWPHFARGHAPARPDERRRARGAARRPTRSIPRPQARRRSPSTTPRPPQSARSIDAMARRPTPTRTRRTR